MHDFILLFLFYTLSWTSVNRHSRYCRMMQEDCYAYFFKVLSLFVADLRPRDHVTSVQRSLNWLPIRQRIQYISNLATLTSATSGRSHLRSADSLTFDIPRTGTRMGDRALSVAGPRAWNALPVAICCAPSLDTFKKHLKAHLFSAAYDI